MVDRDYGWFWQLLLATTVLALAFAFGHSAARAHDYWSNGVPVPPWVKSQCCGPDDVHMLNPGAVHTMQDGYHIDGLANVQPFSKALPSADGKYWAFFKESDGPNAHVYCLFVPLNGA